MTHFRVATWNLDHAYNSSRPKQLQIDQILEYMPDILVLTETCEQVDLTPYGYKVVYPKSKNGYGKYWSSIWYNKKAFFIKEIETANSEVAVCAQFDTVLGKLNIYGTIIAYRDFMVKQGAKPWTEHYKSIQWQGVDWLRVSQLEPNVPLLVAGDFNQTRDRSNRYSTSEGINLLSEALAQSHLVCLTEENFGKSGKLKVDLKKGKPRANIDHICVSKGVFSVVQVGAWDHFNGDGIYTSDHNAVFVDFDYESR